MVFVIGIPDRSPEPPALKEADPVVTLPQLPVPPALPAVVAQKPALPELPALPPRPRAPLMMRLAQAQTPAMNLGPLLFVLTTAVPVAICLAGAAAASVTGGNPMNWINAIGLASPLGTVGIPAAMLGIHTAGAVAETRFVTRLRQWEYETQRITHQRSEIARAAADAADAKAERPRD